MYQQLFRAFWVQQEESLFQVLAQFISFFWTPFVITKRYRLIYSKLGSLHHYIPARLPWMYITFNNIHFLTTSSVKRFGGHLFTWADDAFWKISHKEIQMSLKVAESTSCRTLIRRIFVWMNKVKLLLHAFPVKIWGEHSRRENWFKQTIKMEAVDPNKQSRNSQWNWMSSDNGCKSLH